MNEKEAEFLVKHRTLMEENLGFVRSAKANAYEHLVDQIWTLIHYIEQRSLSDWLMDTDENGMEDVGTAEDVLGFIKEKIKSRPENNKNLQYGLVVRPYRPPGEYNYNPGGISITMKDGKPSRMPDFDDEEKK